jgi:tetratricopeptide (TPR) repeat protein
MGRRSAIEGWSLAAMAAVLMLGLPLSEARAGDLDDAAARQLGLAEADLATGQYQRSADAAASAFRLDGTLHDALVVQGLAFRQLGRLEEAKALLTTYVTIRGTLPLDGRVRPTLALMEMDAQIARGEFDPAAALQAAETAVLELETTTARAYIEAIRSKEGVAPGILGRALEIEALSFWTDGDTDGARQSWRRLFIEYPEATVDPELPPDAMMAMAEEQGVARSATAAPTSPVSRPPPSEAVVFLGSGAAAAALGFGVAGGSYASGIDSYPGVRDSGATWDAEIGSYRNAWTAERVGIAVGATGSALLTAGLVRLIVDRVAAKDRAGARSAPGASK